MSADVAYVNDGGDAAALSVVVSDPDRNVPNRHAARYTDSPETEQTPVQVLTVPKLTPSPLH